MKFYVGSKESGGYFKNEIKKMFANDGGFISVAKVTEIFRGKATNEERQIGWDEKADLGKKMRVRECKDGWYLYLPEPNTKLWFDDNEKEKFKPVANIDLPDIDVCVFETEMFEKLVKEIDDGFTKLANMIGANSGYFHRPCIVKAKKSGLKEERQDRKAWFHRWADLSKGVQQVVGIVEFDDGHVEQVRPDRVVFEVMKDEND